MIRPVPRVRSGITLTEILISILIMGVGLISLATLFPLGLTRLRDATRFTRSTLLAETAASDLQARNMLSVTSFAAAPWYDQNVADFPNGQPFPSQFGINFSYDPWAQDPVFNDANPLLDGLNLLPRYPKPPGFPVAYDPLWWSEIHRTSGFTPANFYNRFASGIGLVRTDPDGNPPSAYGFQRLTNFIPDGLKYLDNNLDPNVNYPQYITWPFVYQYNYPTSPNLPGTVFSSQDDIVFQGEAENPNETPVNGVSAQNVTGIGSPLVPELDYNPNTGALNPPMIDYSFTWIFVGRRSVVDEPSTYDGNIVVFHNRPFGTEDIQSPLTGSTVTVAAGERVYEGIFGYGGPLPPNNPGYGYSNLRDDHVVVVRWPIGMPDPDIRVGSWIADVTYEQYAANIFPQGSRWFGSPYPAQRNEWYQVVKRNQAEPDPIDPVNYRRVVLQVNSAVRSKTLLTSTTNANGQTVLAPVHVNAALFNPYVINVFPRTIHVR